MYDRVNPVQKRNKTEKIVLVFLVLWLYLLNSIIIQQRYELGIVPALNVYYDTPRVVINSAFREVGRTIADMLWIRVDTYFHSALTRQEHELIHPDHPEHELGSETTRAPDANSQFLPLIRLVTNFDPHFIDAYRTGSWWLWNRLNEVNPAIDFLNEGIKNNPDYYELRYDLAWLYFFKLNDYSRAISELNAAQEIVRNNKDKYDNLDLAMILELTAFSYEKMDQFPVTEKLWKEIKDLNVLPYSGVAERRLNELK